MKSLRTRVLLASLTTFLVLGVLFSLGLGVYAEKQYYNRKIEKMVQTGQQIKTQLQLATSGVSIKESLDYLGYQFEGRITLLDIYEDRAFIIYENQRYVYNQGKRVREISYAGHTAFVINTNYPVANSLWLVYLSQVDDNKLALLEIPIVTIDETLDVFRSYIWKSLFIGLLLSVGVSFWLAKSITDPIAELSRLAKKIGRLEFDVDYQSKRQDEIGQLGMTLNSITSILKETIDSLQTEISRKQKLDTMRKRFVAQVSHEMQTPISVISSYTEALIDGMVPAEEQKEYYAILLDECLKMSTMVRELLDLSTLESGLLEYKKERIDLSSFMQGILRKQEKIVKAEGKQIHTHMAEGVFLGDAFRLEQALGNVLGNCIKHAEHNVWVWMQRQGQEMVIQIKNDGPKMEESDLPHVWESFYKGKSKRSGTGLGLAIASEIFKYHQVKYKVFHDDNNYVTYELCFSVI